MRWKVTIEKVAPGAEFTSEGAREYRLQTARGPVEVRHYATSLGRAGVVMVGGAGGGWDTPSKDLYPRLCRALHDRNMDALRVRFRNPRSLEGCAFDVLAGLTYLASLGVERFGLVGHSMGGAVIIQAASRCTPVQALVALATQSYGAHLARDLAPRCACLFLHGARDRILPASCSESTYEIAGEPKRLRIYPAADHGLDEVADDVFAETRQWLVEYLAGEQHDEGQKAG